MMFRLQALHSKLIDIVMTISDGKQCSVVYDPSAAVMSNDVQLICLTHG